MINVSILQELGIKQRLSSIVQSRILTSFGHITRRGDDSMEWLILQEKVEGITDSIPPLQILGVTQGTVEAYLSEIIEEGVELAAEEDASVRAKAQAMKYHDELIENADL